MLVAGKNTTGEVNWSQVANSREFQDLVGLKKKFIIPNVIFFMVFYFTLPISTSYFTFLNEKAIGSLNWAYLFAFAQFAMTWILMLLYAKRANRFDEMAEVVKQQALQVEQGNKEASA